MDFSTRLTNLRKEKKLLQSDVAKQIGVARATYGAYEQGTRQPDFETLQKLSDFFNVSTDYLLGRTETIDQNYSSKFKDYDFESTLQELHYYMDQVKEGLSSDGVPLSNEEKESLIKDMQDSVDALKEMKKLYDKVKELTKEE